MAELPLDIGDAPVIWAEFANVAGVPTNAIVACHVRKPDGTVITPTPTNPTTGRYEAVVPIDMHGTWKFRFVATGALQAAQQGSFYVQPNGVD